MPCPRTPPSFIALRWVRLGRRYRPGVIAITGLVGAVLSTSADAGGLFLYEMGTPDLGTASAGRAAAADNAATAFGNPAGMTRLDQSQMLVGIQPAYGISRFDKGNDTTVSGGNGGNALGFIPGLGGYFVYSATPDLKFGLSLGSDFGLSAQYQSNWSGRYYGTKSELITLGAFPVAAYRVTDWLSVGGGAQILYGRLNSKTSVRNVFGGPDGQIQLESNDVGAGGIAGILIEPAAGTRFGVTYNSAVDLDFNQKPDLSGGGAVFNALDPRISAARVDLGLTVPQQVMISGYHDLTDTVAVMANLVWQDWSAFGQPNLEVSSTTSRSATADLDYKDTWGFALGGRYRFAPDWQWSLGFAFDSSPLSKSQRTPALPLDRQIRVGTGVQYALNERATIGAAYEYLNLGDADMDRDRGALSGRIQGDYATNEIHFFNATLSWKF
ncbi:MAG: outer membrane protein transport protein [Rhodospirillales bacterium]